MDLRGDDFKRTARAPAKLNLFLEVLGTRRDGFHDLETLMVPLRLADQITFSATPAPKGGSVGQIRLDVRTTWPVRSPPPQAEVPTDFDNLVVKALDLLRERSGCRLGANVELVKRVPMAAGLGGGSSDAAAALRLANQGWQINWDNDRLTELAAELGSDVPFFMSCGAAICRGRGEQVERLPPLPSLHFVIVKPPDSLSAGDVYSKYDALASSASPASDHQRKQLLTDCYSSGWRNLGTWMHNCLQAAAGILSPSVEKLRQVFEEFDFVAHQLTGSGSAYYGVCRHAQHARRLANTLRTRQLGLVYATRSCQ
jgi:4-diphosphocytidyl-2-C-methyl-D-erythritol kinase